MDTIALKRFAPEARSQLIGQVAAKLEVALNSSSIARREHPEVVEELEKAIKVSGKDQVIEEVAYTWFNRFSALRFMDVNGYTQTRVVSPAKGETRPEILSKALAGILPKDAPEKIMALLEGQMPSNDPQAEAYRLLLVHTCKHWHELMPYMFERMVDYSELLLPEDLLSESSILSRLIQVMTEDACKDVEIMGWLYQFYISEKKDQVFLGVKQRKKITAENIPAATQLFTPHWIVRYIVENSLGRLWLLNHPDSKLAERMDYYVMPEKYETEFPEIRSPEDIRICDPACGSGHILIYAFDLLYAIYEEKGYEADEIPGLILSKNLTGVEIDNRAGTLAAFALAMKAASKLGRAKFLRMNEQPEICVLRNEVFVATEMEGAAVVAGEELFSKEFQETMRQFEQVRNFGSLVSPKLRNPLEALRVIAVRDFEEDILLKKIQSRVLGVLRMADALSPKYHVVVANPPYMGRRGMNRPLAGFLDDHFPETKLDLYACFVQRIGTLCLPNAFVGLMTPCTWMFISSFESFRRRLFKDFSITSLVHPQYNSFFESASVSLCCFCLRRARDVETKGVYFDLQGFSGASMQPVKLLEAINDPSCNYKHKVSPIQFEKIPGFPIAYWASPSVQKAFSASEKLGDIYKICQGMSTSDNIRFIRNWQEVSHSKIGHGCKSRLEAKFSGRKWFPYNKGGPFRRWYGNNSLVLNWENDGENLRNYAATLTASLPPTIRNKNYYFLPSVTWSALTIGSISMRWSGSGFLFDSKGGCIFHEKEELRQFIIGMANSKAVDYLLTFLAPTMDYSSGAISKLPFYDATINTEAIASLVEIAKSDWDSYETSWDFTTLPLISAGQNVDTLEAAYGVVRGTWRNMVEDMQRLEEENNRIFIQACGLDDDLTPEVPLKKVTLTCNPAHRYGSRGDSSAHEKSLLSDTMAEFISYAVGCMFGRYSLDAPGLILANQGERLEDYLACVPEPSFMPSEDNIIPVLGNDWFSEDITERFRLFLQLAFGEEKFLENLKFIEGSLGKTVQKYFLRDFFRDHVKRYKKRPIYWMFSSPKGTFQALTYMHRYRSDTVSVLLNEYLRPLIIKLEAERNRLRQIPGGQGITSTQSARALKDMDKISAQLAELTEWEREVIYPLAQKQVELDLDDGVRANYPKFGLALKNTGGII